MNRFTTAFVLALALAAPAGAFTVDMSMPVLTFPQPTETTQACILPAGIGTPTCSAAE